MTTIEAARRYLARGFMPLPIRNGKDPGFPGWQKFEVTEQDLEKHFAFVPNVGLLLGKPSGNLVDVDLDCLETRELAFRLLPRTAMRGGRKRSPSSHFFYRCEDARTQQWVDPDVGPDDKRLTLVEIRATGAQTLVSPSKHPSGDDYEWADGASLEPATVSYEELRKAVGRLAASALITRRWKPGQRHHLALALAGALCRAGWQEREIRDFIEPITYVADDADREDRFKAIETTIEKIEVDQRATGIPTLVSIVGERVVSKLREWLELGSTHQKIEEPSPATHETNIYGQRLDFINQLTDESFAERFVALHKATVRWCSQWKAWLVFDGMRWVEDGALTSRLALDVSRYWFTRAAQSQDKNEEKEYGKIALRLLSERSLRSILELAKKHLTVDSKIFDTNPYLFNTPSGTLNVITGNLQEHNSEDFITRLSPTEYQGDIACNRWMLFLEEIFCEDYEVIKYVRKAAGLSLCGNIEESVLLLCTGDGANGKTTFLEALAGMMGEDYAKSTSPELLLGSDSREQSHELAGLRGIRMAITAESGKGRRLNEAMLKRITGGDTVSARRIYGSPEQFKPEFTAWMATNHKPRVVDTSHATWRRLKQIPFDAHFEGENCDSSLGKTLRNEYPGILFWAARGYREYLEEGLADPVRISESVSVYRKESDQIGNFIDQSCELGDFFEVHAGDLYKAYRQWAQDTGEHPDNQQSFGRRLTAIGLEVSGEGRKRRRKGIRLNESSVTM